MHSTAIQYIYRGGDTCTLPLYSIYIEEGTHALYMLYSIYIEEGTHALYMLYSIYIEEGTHALYMLGPYLL